MTVQRTLDGWVVDDEVSDLLVANPSVSGRIVSERHNSGYELLTKALLERLHMIINLRQHMA